MTQDLLGYQLAGDVASQVGWLAIPRRRKMPTQRASPHLRDPALELSMGDRAAADDRHDARRPDLRQPFTPPTVIPSMKNRWKNTNIRMIGRTISVDAAISRL